MGKALLYVGMVRCLRGPCLEDDEWPLALRVLGGLIGLVIACVAGQML